MEREQPPSSAKDRTPWQASGATTHPLVTFAPWSLGDDGVVDSAKLAARKSSHTGLRLIAVNDAAARAGLYPGKNLADARALEPHLHAIDADPMGDSRALSGLADWCGRYSPWTAAAGLEGDGSGGIWIDISGCAHLFGDEAALLGDLVGQLARLGYAARVGVADTPGTAWAVARYGHGDSDGKIIVPAGAQEVAIRGLPIAGLRLPAAIVGDLDRLGLRRIGDLLALPRGGLAARFGAVLTQRLDQALGRIAEPISPRQPQPSLRVRMNFAEPIGRPEDIAAAAKQLLAVLMKKLDELGRGVRRLVLTLNRSDGQADIIEIRTNRASRDVGHLWRLLNEKLDRMPEDTSADNLVDLLILGVLRSEPIAARQTKLAGGHSATSATSATGVNESTQAAIASLVDRLSNRLGGDRVVQFRARESHLPERAQMAIPALTGSLTTAHPPRPRPRPRPPRLLWRPEPVTAVAPVPDDPPVLFCWRGRSYRVARADGPERLETEWWRATAPLGEEARDYYRVEDEAGQRFWLYRAGHYQSATAPPQWFLHGFFA